MSLIATQTKNEEHAAAMHKSDAQPKNNMSTLSSTHTGGASAGLGSNSRNRSGWGPSFLLLPPKRLAKTPASAQQLVCFSMLRSDSTLSIVTL